MLTNEYIILYFILILLNFGIVYLMYFKSKEYEETFTATINVHYQPNPIDRYETQTLYVFDIKGSNPLTPKAQLDGLNNIMAMFPVNDDNHCVLMDNRHELFLVTFDENADPEIALGTPQPMTINGKNADEYAIKVVSSIASGQTKLAVLTNYGKVYESTNINLNLNEIDDNYTDIIDIAYSQLHLMVLRKDGHIWSHNNKTSDTHRYLQIVTKDNKTNSGNTNQLFALSTDKKIRDMSNSANEISSVSDLSIKMICNGHSFGYIHDNNLYYTHNLSGSPIETNQTIPSVPDISPSVQDAIFLTNTNNDEYIVFFTTSGNNENVLIKYFDGEYTTLSTLGDDNANIFGSSPLFTGTSAEKLFVLSEVPNTPDPPTETSPCMDDLGLTNDCDIFQAISNLISGDC